MCGIAGIFAYRESSPPVDHEELLRTREQMARRGPDGAGLWMSADRRVGLAHRRLAIIDVSDAGAQPMATADGLLRVTFNGEIYNYRELRLELEAKGYRFHTQSDTEVLLHLYADRGNQMVRDLRGMYAFAIWDERKRGMFLARDAFGIKPLYFSDNGVAFRFASQVKALLAGRGIPVTPHPAGHVGFFLWGAVPEPFTLYKEISSLPAGSTLWVSRSGPHQTTNFFDIRSELIEAAARCRVLSVEAIQERVSEAVRTAVRYHMIADVPVGVFLSAGIDSSTVTGLASESTNANLRSITLGFAEYRDTENDETPIAEIVARNFGTSHETQWISQSEFETVLEDIIACMDQPTIDGVNTYLISKVAARSGMKVALSGVGGDELFGGYPSFRHVPLLSRLFRFGQKMPRVGVALRRLTGPILRLAHIPKYASLLEYGGSIGGAYLLRRALFMPWELSPLMDETLISEGLEQLDSVARLEQSAMGIPGDRAKVIALESIWYMRQQLLRDADWAGMAHGLEIRVPLVDVNLFRAVAPMAFMDDPVSKKELARSTQKPLPKQTLGRRKTGFSVPVETWISAGIGPSWQRYNLRNWSRTVYRRLAQPAVKILYLTTDAFGGRGGIALYNRDFLAAVCSHPRVSQVVAIPRLMPDKPEPHSEKLQFVTAGLDSKLGYVATLLRVLWRQSKFDMVMCGHINLLGLAHIISRWRRTSLLLLIYGIDAWYPKKSMFLKSSLARVNCCISISEVTRDRFAQWPAKEGQSMCIIPNAIHMEQYGIGERNLALIERHNLNGKKIIMTLGRLDSSERYKGFDEVLDLLPSLIAAAPDIIYLIVGDGPDRPRLERKVDALGLEKYVRFTGFIPEHEKADHYRIADAYVMPSRGEGFGFVFLEAMACGVPCVGSTLDGSREALRWGELGQLVDPTDPEQLRHAVLSALAQPKRVPDGLDFFSYQNFERRVHETVDCLIP